MERLLEKYQVKWFDDGRQEGRQEGVFDIAKALLRKQIDFNTICECTGLSAEELQELQSEVRA